MANVLFGKESPQTDGHQAKYKNSRSTAIFNRITNSIIWAKNKTNHREKSWEVYLMEGFMDVIAAYRAGIENAVASMGTALTHEHVQHLSKYCKKVILSFDGVDKAEDRQQLLKLWMN